MQKSNPYIGIILVGSLILSVISIIVIKKIMDARKYLKPVPGPITSKFGNRLNPISGVSEFHNGTDFGSPLGTPVEAPHKGVVADTYYNSLGGNQIILLHSDGFKTGYAHLDTILVQKGDIVTQGQEIGTVGKTGQVTGAHLHFTVIDPSGNFIDPQIFLELQ